MHSIIRKRELCARLSVSQATIWRWVRAKQFPAPIKLGENSVAWVQSEIDEWLAQRAAERK